jgi:hypothetical protein
MISRYLLALALCAFAGSNAVAAADVDAPAVYFDGGQYTATLEQREHHWRLLPVQGDDVDVVDHAPACSSRVHVPHGVWMVTSDTSGHPQLVAPSATALPAGFPGQLQLRACSDSASHDNALLVPDVVLDWIKTNVSSVMIND